MAEGISPELEAILAALGENTESSIAGMTGTASIGAEAALEQQRRQQEFLDKASKEAIGYYEPFITAGNYWGGRAKTMIDEGAPAYSWDKSFDYDTWKYDKEFNAPTWGEYSKDRFTTEGIKESPYYGLYQYQKEQQEAATNKALRARGAYNSGAGLKEALNKQSGIDESFTANEYNRARSEYDTDYNQLLAKYTMDYNQKLQEHNIGYEEAKQKYGMTYDQYLKAFGVEQGQYTDKLNTMLGLREDQWRGSQGAANARIGEGNQLGQGAIQTGQTIAGLQSNLASGIGSAYNAQGNQLLGLYNTTANNATTLAGINAGANAANSANNTNAWLGGATAAAGAGRTLFDAYRYYNANNAPATTTGDGSGIYDTGSYDYGNYWDTGGDGAYW